jgi:uridine kinase
MGCGASASPPPKAQVYKTPSTLPEAVADAKRWAAAVDCPSAAAVSAKLAADAGPVNTILLAEAWHDAQIVEVVRAIQAKRDATQNAPTPLSLILIAGPSSSGKTTFCAKLSMHLRCVGIRPDTLSTDDYFLARVDPRHPRDEQGALDFETVDAVDVEKLNVDLKRLFAGDTVETPIFNFKNGAPEENNTRSKKLSPGGVLVMEGIHSLNPKLTPQIEQAAKFGIFIAPNSPLTLKDGSDLREDYVRLVRRISRDFLHRGRSALETVKKYDTVRKGEVSHIFPYVSDAEFMYNSSLLYEVHVLKPKIMPLLQEIKEEEAGPAFSRVKEILALLENFEATAADEVPSTSLLMEFIGNSVFEE